MQTFIKKISIFFLLWLLLLAGGITTSHFWVKRNVFTNANQEGNLFVLKEEMDYDYLVLGISHARNLSRRSHHAKFESVFNGSMVNLAQGESLGGLENQLMYLRLFLARSNNAKNLVLVLSPSLMFNRQTDQSDIMFYREPLKSFLVANIINSRGDRKWHQLFHYVKSKLSHHWWLLKPDTISRFNGVLARIDQKSMQQGFELAYPNGLSAAVFKNRAAVLNELVATAYRSGMRVHFVIPPASFGIWPGHGVVLAYLQRNFPESNILDHAEAITGLENYYDHHHLNTKGVESYLPLLYESIKRE